MGAGIRAVCADWAEAEAQVEVELLDAVAQHVGEPLVDMAAVPPAAAVEGDTEAAQRHVGAGAPAAAEERRPDVVEEDAAAALHLGGLVVEGGPVAIPMNYLFSAMVDICPKSPN